MQRIGLTGGIGSGKSTVAKLLHRCNAFVIDADAVSRQLTGEGGRALPDIFERFGSGVMQTDGSLNRDAVRTLMLQDPFAKRQLEAILHTMIADETAKLSQHALQAGYRCAVFDIPLLVESLRWRCSLDQVLVVDCRHATQISRVLTRESDRRGWTVDAVEKIIAVQASRAQRLAAADICIYNDNISLDVLARVTDEVAASFGL